ncbi:YcnI family copper-binding membrane protein [Nocardioides nitrophenolicus]|uniref:YcnI family copper-binding membrane protein n=1 Tax=Nocardioides nitrophenolicus TaxID=60489 RepID=UPI00195C7C45|nr:YcnI family protein [Nocardioides nitrophenolicus]MBM7516688.1 uncharacterized protein YcnI [Nocardioides nitrophenolicus]
MSLVRPALVRPALLGATTLGLLVATAPAAGAHVTVTPSTTAAGASAVLTFAVGHGCDGSPTTAITIRMPEEIVAVTPTVNAGWEVRKEMEPLATPVSDGHGGEYTERVAQVVYTADTPLPEGYRDTFALSLRLPEQEGARVAFPVVQACAEGETAWVQTYAEGEDEPDSPAPFVTVGAADPAEAGHGTGHTAAVVESDGDEEDAAGGTGAVGWLALALGALGLAAGGAALARSRG